MVTRLKNVAPVQFGLVSAILYALIGLIGALVFLGTTSMVPNVSASSGMPKSISAIFGVAAIVVFPIVYAVIGFVGGLITALLYNLVSRWTGGVEFTLETAGPSVASQ